MGMFKPMKCPDCGAKLNVDVKKAIATCPYCGLKVDMADWRSVETVNVNAEGASSEGAPAQGKKLAEDPVAFARRKRLILLLVGILTAAALAFIVYLVVSVSSAGSATPTQQSSLGDSATESKSSSASSRFSTHTTTENNASASSASASSASASSTSASSASASSTSASSASASSAGSLSSSSSETAGSISTFSSPAAAKSGSESAAGLAEEGTGAEDESSESEEGEPENGIVDMPESSDEAAEPKVYTDGSFTVGKDLPAGEYILYGFGDEHRSHDTGHIEVKRSVDGYEIGVLCGSFNGTTYVMLEEPWYVTLPADTTMVSIDDLPQRLLTTVSENGMYKVGFDIPAGWYTVEPGYNAYAGKGSGIGKFFVWSSYLYDSRRLYLDSGYATADEYDEFKAEEGNYVQIYNAVVTRQPW